MPLRVGHGRGAPAAAGAEERSGIDRMGRPQPAAARQRTSERGLQRRGFSAPDRSGIGTGLPAHLRQRRDRGACRLPHSRNLLLR